MVTSLEKFVFASHLRKPKIRNKAHDFPKPITSQTLLTEHRYVARANDLSARETEKGSMPRRARYAGGKQLLHYKCGGIRAAAPLARESLKERRQITARTSDHGRGRGHPGIHRHRQ